MNNYKITDLIELNILQEIQDAFSNLVGMAALITDADGNLITKPSNFNDYCACTQKSDIGCTKCTECHKESAKTSYEKGISISNVCFAGLSGYSAPIIVNNEIIGCFHGGQVLTKEPDEEEVRKIANEIGVNPDEYFKEIKKIKVVDKQQVDMAIQFLETFSKIFSDIAEGKNKTLLASEEIARAAKMKTDFLANMSHEIRTPMNAVIGMAEMALREDIPNTARDYIIQIKSSGRALLAIINDILDFSKIESGKMDIIPIEYDSMSMFNDVSNIAMTRLVDKDVELDLDITPDLPAMLFGDNIRIRQILINLTNNAVKFTKTGSIKIIVDFERQENSMGILKVAVKDTGIGIKKEDMQKIFESFQQVDSTRNREVEGTGLGLAICQNLLKLMNGSLHVESEYEKGSCFSFEIPQIIVDADAAMVVKEPKKSIAISMFSNKLLAESFARDSAKLGVKVVNLPKDMDLDELYTAIKNKNIDATLFFFIEKEKLTFKRKKFIREHPEIIAVLVADFIAEARPSLSNMLIVKKPLSAMNLSMIYNREKISFAGSHNEDDDIDYTAPEAWALIVDDNAVNLTVAEGLLEPLKIKTATANSGKEALKKTLERRYDLIFMDHMMPEMDGIEATQKIRELREGYKDVPIIALTANAVGNAREMFLEAGLNDFIAKPIEVRTLLTKVKQWLPKDKIVMMSEEERKERMEERRDPEELTEENTEKETLEIDDLDISGAIRLLGSEKLFWSVLKEYYRVIKSKTETIRKYYAEEDWQAYTIEVHALKSSSKQIGALELSAMALDLEMAGKEKRIDFIRENTEKALEKYMSYEPIFAPYFEEAEENAADKPPISKDVLIDLFAKIKEALDDLDMDTAEGVCNELDKYSYSDNQKDYPKKIRSACDDIDIDQCLEIISDWEKII
jgi:signal transduction histidine kinase/CheY-like chemotaxis protein/HPt (histidine-containing phosphotransfer) domain-containing protein